MGKPSMTIFPLPLSNIWPCTGKRTLTTFHFWAGFRLQPFVNRSKKICIRSNYLVTCLLETPTRSNDLVTRSLKTLTRSNDLVTRSLETSTCSNDLTTCSFERVGHLFTGNTVLLDQIHDCNNYSGIGHIFSFTFLHQLSGITFFVS